ncbi:S-methyl-5-thioribose-1-phosphate isomerase [Alkalilimnicola sp. S0819]|uniref:S-methyl-5-thioribose-1-phosphate isomerase n=1 Tax=Alkalilimnicola sp. S0819 TaxID=2613922 RepID=UPI00126153CE|nr:S-methyl-5-thioribose-1-phosphate isomerase [Alkalilimnicola sp. S0819]KAB7623728.1 S-methyl-5-thioribose-1-phosphate isomerase [Alkalilimnicola sp. S0819]MPQ16794.1 S-methyl-5-thioribose-1-phosphate isomerase [Alkalilimnicola sp. S0819]
MSAGFDRVRPIAWTDEGLELLDQRLLPGEERYLLCQDVAAVAAAIRDMVVRGAPAIGIAAAYAVVLAARARYAASPLDWRGAFAEDLARLAESRPTAVNLGWALARMRPLLDGLDGDPEPALLAEAERIHSEDLATNRRMGELGAACIEGPTAVLTHCNTGSLATGGYGTALGVIRSAWAAGKLSRVYADETRPWLQGARLTAWELGRDEIPVCLLADAAAPALMRQGGLSWVIVGADRITANGDVANKIGTYGLALAARAHGLRFMVVAPTSTVDMSLASGDSIPIESRPAEEVLQLGGQPVAAVGAEAWNPVFDVTPAEYVDVLVTERGVVERPNPERMAGLLARG